jgi:mRNA-degrading endonuclease RelE of RelBE toxin-antitoxin system
MIYKVRSIPEFEKELKKLVKKSPSLKDEYFQLVQELKSSPKTRMPLIKNCYKIRIAIKSKGKSGGGRVITHFAITEDTVFLL